MPFFRLEPSPSLHQFPDFNKWLSKLHDFINRLAPSVGEDIGNADATVTWSRSAQTQIANTPLTAPRTITIVNTYAVIGSELHFVRTTASTGASGLSIGGLKTLATGQWCDIVFNGTSWILKRFGTL